MSVEVAVFSPVEELLAETVAPGMSELPDFTTPEMEREEMGRVCAEGASWPKAGAATSRRMAKQAMFSTTSSYPQFGPGRSRAASSMKSTSHQCIQHCPHAQRVKSWSTTVKFRQRNRHSGNSAVEMRLAEPVDGSSSTRFLDTVNGLASESILSAQDDSVKTIRAEFRNLRPRDVALLRLTPRTYLSRHEPILSNAASLQTDVHLNA